MMLLAPLLDMRSDDEPTGEAPASDMRPGGGGGAAFLLCTMPLSISMACVREGMRPRCIISIMVRHS